MKARLIGLLVLLCCALIYAPEGTQPRLLGALVVPCMAAAGFWLVLPNPVLLSGCVCALALAQTMLGSPDIFTGTLYPLVAVAAAILFARQLWLRRHTKPDPHESPPDP